MRVCLFVCMTITVYGLCPSNSLMFIEIDCILRSCMCGLGRHLVVEWASTEGDDDEDDNEAAAIATAKLQNLRKRASADLTAIRAQHAVASRAGKKAKIEDMLDSGSFEEAES